MKTAWYHVAAIMVVLVWGTTFISTKTLLNHGLSPADIFFYRFFFSAVGLWLIARGKVFADNLRDELCMAFLGFTGGSLYFLAENTALGITQVSNVALLVCTAPLITTFLTYLMLPAEKVTRRFVQGSLLALIGVALVIFNGHFALKLNPLGDGLSLLAAVSWSFYTIVLQRSNKRYSTLFITRKVFSYGVITLLPVLFIRPPAHDFALFSQAVVLANMLFLTVIASLGCYFVWNVVVKKLGAIHSSNYLYVVPLVALLASSVALDEQITALALVGAALILSGMGWAERK